MKKVLAILALAAVFTACNNATEEAAAPANTADTSNPAADALKDAEAAKAALDSPKNNEISPMDTIKDGLKKAVTGIKEGTKEVVNKVAEGAKEVGKDVKKATHKVAEKVSEATKN